MSEPERPPSGGSPQVWTVPFVTASLADLVREPPPRCDACGALLALQDTADDEGFAVPGRGTYVWSRGEEIRREDVPLCPSCAAAIGLSALARWEIEEEEG